MNNPATESIRLKIPPELQERMELALDLVLPSGVSSWQAMDSNQIQYDAFFENAEDADRAFNALNLQILDASLPSNTTSIERLSIPATDWANAWKQHFHTDAVTPRIVIKPSWETYYPTDNQIVIEMDPGMSFGTGQHETTRGCIAMIEKLVTSTPLSLLDLGCGSGILSIVAAKIGYSPIHACDIDPVAVEASIKNATHNQVADRIQIFEAGLESLPGTNAADVVVANILAPVLIDNAAIIQSTVKPGGHLILAGLLSTQTNTVCNAFNSSILSVSEVRTIGEWDILHMIRSPADA